MNHSERSFSVGRKCEVCRGIESVGIDTFSDRGRCHYFSCVRVDDGHHLVVAAGEEAATLPVYGQT